MDLKRYLSLAGMTQKDLAVAAKCGQPTISQIITGKRKPSPDLALRIERATGGAVRAAELVFGRAGAESGGDFCVREKGGAAELQGAR
ncbi:MAG: helix-turn-helix transcriptional regulator [Desulfobacterales bacterium]